MAASATSLEYVQKMFIAYFGRPAAPSGLEYYGELVDAGNIAALQDDFWNSAESQALFSQPSTEGKVNAIFNQLFGRDAGASGLTYWAVEINSGRVSLPSAALTILNSAAAADAAVFAAKLDVANAFTGELDTTSEILGYQGNTAGGRVALSAIETQAAADAAVAGISTIVASVVAGGSMESNVFTLTAGTAAGADVMGLAGDQDVRIDFTNPANQIKGLDLNGDGTIANDGVENTITGRAANFEIVDAYARNPLNESDRAANFLGDIRYDGTGFAGDGVNTDGNIVLGGLGADTILGGIGNDFLAGGGVAVAREAAARAAYIAQNPQDPTGARYVAVGDSLSGGRNADFAFTELSLLDNVDGNNLTVDGGATADNNSAGTTQSLQDTDWLLVQASDDDEPVTINLEDHLADENGDGNFDNDGSVVTRAGVTATLRDIENVDASGNLYGFLDDMNTVLGGARAVSNQGVGSSAQLVINGTIAVNRLIGGFDNDVIDGGSNDDVLMGGNLKNYLANGQTIASQLINPNLLTISNDGRDELTGGSGNDQIAFEADGGVVEGGATQNVDDTGIDTLWITQNSLGTVSAANASTVITDATIRMDLAAGKAGGLNNAAGYGGADLNAATGNYTADQSNYNAANAGKRVQVQDMENVIATGLGAIDFKAAGANSADDLAWANQQNFQGYTGNLDLRGTYATLATSNSTDSDGIPFGANLDPTAAVTTIANDGLTTTIVTPWKAAGGAIVGTQTTVTTAAVGGVNTLYANAGDDVLEGRTGGTLTFDNNAVVTADNRDKLSGGQGSDDFIFNLGVNSGDGVDVIHRQTNLDVDGNGVLDNLTDGTFGVDFGEEGAVVASNSQLTINLPSTATALVDGIQFILGGTTYTVSGLASATFAAFNTALNAGLDANAALVGLNAVLNADNTITITDPAGAVFAKSTSGWILKDGALPPDGTSSWSQTVGAPATTQDKDTLKYVSYEDRLDGELTDDDATTGSSISLGLDSYAEDLVVDFAADGTRIAEDQSYVLTFTNLTTEDKVSITVNSIKYELTVGVDLDGNEIAGEELLNQGGTAANQADIQTAFLERMQDFIVSFMDNDTTAGQVDAVATATTLTLNQVAYNGEETVFMRTPTVAIVNGSGGELATVTVLNNSEHEVQLLDFNGRNGELDATNVLFLGNSDVSRAVLQTGLNTGTTSLAGSEAVVVDGGNNTLQSTLFGSTTAIANNTATNNFLRTDFTVHGDDLLISGAASETITGGTGDDRVLGSLGTDSIDGGKSYYAVQVLGEAQARVYVLNQWEAQNPTLVTALQALTISSINRVGDAETGNATPVSAGTAEVYNDTLQFQQGDFSANTNFTVTLDGFTGATAATVQFRNGGAGKVTVDDAGNGTTDATSTFTNFENIRTVSGTGNAVANDGQGNDTLNVSALSAAAAGISYDLTSNAVTAGDVRYSANASINQLALAAGQTASVLAGATVASVKAAIVGAQQTATFQTAVNAIPVTGSTTIAGFLASVSALALLTRPTSDADAQVNVVGTLTDYETQVIKVDGVENVIAGTGKDLLLIDQSEAAKNNSFDAGLGNDRIEYRNDYNTLATRDMNDDGFDGGALGSPDQLIAEDFSEATVTIKLDNIAAVTTAATGTDTVTMTSGRVGTTVAVDSLTAVERITLGGNTAEGRAEADVIDVTAMTTGAIVDYTNGQVRDLTGTVHVTVEGIVDIETVWADGNDTVIVADSAVMATNAREDTANLTVDQNILFMNYVDFNDLNTGLTTRKSFAAQVADDSIMNVVNQGEYTFSLSKVGTDADTDRVDYSAEQGRIIAAVGQGTATTPQYIIVDGDSDNDWTDADSRVDVLESVEEIVASLGESVLDFTTVNAARQITFQYNTAIANPAENAVLEQTIRIADGSGNTISGLNAFVEKYTYNKTTAPVADATWNRVEGGDLAEVVIYQGSEDLVNQAGLDHRYTNDTLTLRGGANEVRYSPIETSVTAAITVTEENLTTLGTAEGLIRAVVTFQDGIGGGLAGGGTHIITSHSSDNSTAAGNLKIEGSQDAEDTVSFTTASQKVFVLGTSPGVINVNIGALNAIVLTGFERLQDSASNDVYDFKSMTAIAGVTIVDDAVANSTDHDVIKVVNDAINYNVAGTNTIDLDNLGATLGGFNFDFDVLDVTSVTNGSLILNGGSNDIVGPDAGPANATDTDTTDEVVLGNLSLVTSIADFETMVMTQATTAGGTTFGFNAATNQLTQGSTTVTTSANVLSFGGLVRELTTTTVYGKSTVADVTTGVTVNVTGVAGAEVHGGAGADVLNGSDGADILRGGAGNDTLNGGVSSEVRFTQINPTGAAGATGTAITVTLDGFVLTLNNLTVPVDVDADAGDNLDIAPAGGSNAVGAALATLINANLADINNGVRFDGVQLLNAAYSDSTGNLTYTFAAGTDVAITDTIVVAGAGLGAITVTNDNLVSNGGAAGNDTYIVDAGSDTISALNASDVLQVYTGATATASGVAAFTATAGTQNLGTVTINAASGGSTINLASAAATSTLGGVVSTATNGFTVVGGAGVDNFTGSSKADSFTGGAGADVYNVAHDSSPMDTFVGFATGVDKINVSPVTVEYLEVDASSLTQAAILALVNTLSDSNTLGTGGTGIDDNNETIVVYYNVAGSGNAIAVLDNIDDGTYDYALMLTGVSTAVGVALTDFV